MAASSYSLGLSLTLNRRSKSQEIVPVDNYASSRNLYSSYLPIPSLCSKKLTCKIDQKGNSIKERRHRAVVAMAADGAQGGPQTSFLSLEEAGLVEMAGLDMHERFLARLTVSSLNLLRVISEQEGIPIEELNAGLICDWFLKDKAKRAEDINSAVLKWDHGPDW